MEFNVEFKIKRLRRSSNDDKNMPGYTQQVPILLLLNVFPREVVGVITVPYNFRWTLVVSR